MASVVRIIVLVWADILAMHAVWVVMIYLSKVWKLNLTHAAAIVNVFNGAAAILPIGMTFLVDAFMGHYFMLLLSSVAYSIGMSFLAMSTPPVLSDAVGTCGAYKPDCIGNTQKVLFYTALALIAIGIAGHMTSLGSFLRQQMQLQTVDQHQMHFGRYLRLFAVIFLSIVGGIALPFIKPWSVRFGIPAIFTVVATLLFLSGTCSYKNICSQGSSEVEETKFSMCKNPTWIFFIMCGMVSSIGATYFLEQANHMNRKVGGLKVPLSILIVIHDVAKSLFEKGSGKCPPRIRIAVAMIISILCCITAAKVETRRLDVIRSHMLLDKPREKIPISMFWLLPQFILLGALDGISGCRIEHFSIDQHSSSFMFKHGVFGAGIMGSVLSVYTVGKVSEKGGKPSWFQDTLNGSRLDNYYWTLAVLSSVNLAVYILVALWYAYQESATEDIEPPRHEESARHFDDDDDDA